MSEKQTNNIIYWAGLMWIIKWDKVLLGYVWGGKSYYLPGHFNSFIIFTLKSRFVLVWKQKGERINRSSQLLPIFHTAPKPDA